ncbi:MAG: hypothetical protein M3445_07475 [Actinomycetota bacterium]|nr:hypothetical protein [Actinomycetota bacterium]
MDLKDVAGLVLVLVGVAWMVAAEIARRRSAPRARGNANLGWIEKVLSWASQNLARELLPGVLLIVLGVVLLLR